MAHNIDLTAAIRANKQDNRSRSSDFPSSSTEKTYSFRDSLKEAVKDRSPEERRPEAKIELRKELIGRSETKLKNLKKPIPESDEINVPVEENQEEQTGKVNKSMEELLSNLEELTKLQQLGEVPVEKKTVLLEGIKEALKELTAMQGRGSETKAELQSKISELSVKLEGMLEELKVSGSMVKQEFSDFAKELKSVVAETVKQEAAAKPQTENNTAEPVKMKVSDSTDKAPANNTTVGYEHDEAVIAENKAKADSLINEVHLSKEAVKTPDNEIKPEVPAGDAKPVIKEAQPAAAEADEEINADVKTAVDSKVEKVTVEGKVTRKQEEDTESGKETAYKAPKEIDTAPHKLQNEEMTAVKPNQAAADNKAEAVQNQVTAPKAEPVSKTDVINQIVKKAEIVFTDSKQEMRMQLEPENLGKLTLKLAVEKGLITAKFVAESQEVKQVIESNFNELKDMLKEKGLEVQNFSVSVGQDNKEYSSDKAFQQWKETVKLNGRSLSKVSYDGYQAGEDTQARTVNPYSIHNGKFDHRA